MEKIGSENFEIFEIHSMPKDVIVYTLLCTNNVRQYYRTYGVNGYVRIPRLIKKGTYTAVITHKRHGEPTEASFVPATKRIKLIHKYIDKIKEYLDNPNLEIKYYGKENHER